MKHFIAIGFLLLSLLARAQNRTNVWELSYTYDDAPKCELRYTSGIMDTTSVFRVMSFLDTDGDICDTGGNLLFYSNGLTIGNRNYDTLQNAVNFNPGAATDHYEPDGLGIDQAVLFLPDPASKMRYYVFHISGEYFDAYGEPQLQPLHLSYSVIDMSLDGGLGGIIDSLKNKYIIEDTLLNGGLNAAKHANGRDWWIVIHRFYTNKYYKLLLSPYGISGPFEQTIGSSDLNDNSFLQTSFSPDGTKYCIATPDSNGQFDYMNFDRCSGEFFNEMTINSSDSLGFVGCSFSPNSRFLYINTRYNLYQYDTWDSNMASNAIHIAAWDTFYQYGIPVLFGMHQIAPDGRIYLSPWNGLQYLNVINSPDSFGVACDFLPHSFLLTNNGYTDNIPSFPNYDLGPLEGSPCDTLYLSNQTQSSREISFSLSPNPSSSYINIIYQTEKEITATITDAYGREVNHFTLYPYFKNRIVWVNDLPDGIYLVTLKQGSRQQSKKLVVEH